MSEVLSQAEIDKMLADSSPPEPPKPVLSAVPPTIEKESGSNLNQENRSQETLLDPSVMALLQRVLDINIDMSVEIGRAKVLVQDLLELHKGSVIELSKSIGEKFEVLVNGHTIAKGEVVVINEKYGLLISDILDQIELVRKLKS